MRNIYVGIYYMVSHECKLTQNGGRLEDILIRHFILANPLGTTQKTINIYINYAYCIECV